MTVSWASKRRGNHTSTRTWEIFCICRYSISETERDLNGFYVKFLIHRKIFHVRWMVQHMPPWSILQRMFWASDKSALWGGVSGMIWRSHSAVSYRSRRKTSGVEKRSSAAVAKSRYGAQSAISPALMSPFWFVAVWVSNHALEIITTRMERVINIARSYNQRSRYRDA